MVDAARVDLPAAVRGTKCEDAGNLADPNKQAGHWNSCQERARDARRRRRIKQGESQDRQGQDFGLRPSGRRAPEGNGLHDHGSSPKPRARAQHGNP
jgi:hypothetical protein